MARSPDQRLDAVEDELETAKRLLLSAASYAESANQGLDQLTVRVDRIAEKVDALTVKADDLTVAQVQNQRQLDELTAAQSQTQSQLNQLSIRMDELTAAQSQTQTQLNQLSTRVDELTAAQSQTQTQLNQFSTRVDEFVFQAQRLFSQQGERLIRVEGLTESLVGIVQRLDRNYSAQQSQLQEFQRTTNAALERIDRVLDYLLRQQGNS